MVEGLFFRQEGGGLQLHDSKVVTTINMQYLSTNMLISFSLKGDIIDLTHAL